MAENEYRYIGTMTEITGDIGRTFAQFGEKVTLPRTPKEASHSMFIPEEEWQTIGFTEEEAERWQNASDHEYWDPNTNKMVMNAPAEFLDKKKKAIAVMHRIRTGS